MIKTGFIITLFVLIILGCAQVGDGTRIVKIIDFELSPDEDKVAFSALTPIGNTDIWVIDIDGTNLKKLTFKDRSPSNHIARFFRRHKWRNFFEIDMRSPEWTKAGRIAFCQKLTKHDMRGAHTVSLRYWTINSDGTNKRPKTDDDEVLRKRPFGPVNKYKTSERSEKHRKEIYLEDDALWILGDGETNPRKLIQ